MPTEIERQHLASQPRFNSYGACELCGFGPVAAAARTASQIAVHKPDRVLLIGIAGTFDSTVLPVGGAAFFSRVRMHGIGVGSDESFVPAEELGFQQWAGAGPEDGIGDELMLTVPIQSGVGSLLTVSAASASTQDARQRLQRYPGVVADSGDDAGENAHEKGHAHAGEGQLERLREEFFSLQGGDRVKVGVGSLRICWHASCISPS